MSVNKRMTLTEAQEFVQQHNSYAEQCANQEYLSYLCQALASLRPATVLNVYPQCGVLAVWLCSRGWDITAVDTVSIESTMLTPELVEKVGLRYKQIDIREGRLIEEFRVVVILGKSWCDESLSESVIHNAGKMLAEDGLFVAGVLEKGYPCGGEAHASQWLYELVNSGFEWTQVWQPNDSNVVLVQAKFPIDGGGWS